MHKLFYSLILMLLTGCSHSDSLKITGLFCNNRVSPVGVEDVPVFRWQAEAMSEGAGVSEWELKLTTEGKTMIFNKIKEVEWVYDGAPLKTGRKYDWQVRLKDKMGKITQWSQKAHFVTGLSNKQWESSKWIALEELPDSLKIIPGVHGSGDDLRMRGLRRPAIPLFRREFAISKKVEGAYLFISGLGQYTISIDGRSPDDRFLSPGWTLYSKTCFYDGYDLTNRLSPGIHAIGITVGNGFFNIDRERYRKLVAAWGMPMMRIIVLINYADGSSEQLVSDNKWKTAASPVTYTSIYGGEDFDSRLKQPGWDLPGFDESKWQKVLIVKGPGGCMKSEEDYPLKIMQTFKPAITKKMPNGTFVYDFGQNASGIPEIWVSNAANRTIRLTPGEVLDNNGYVDQTGSGGPMYFEYTADGNKTESWRPSFSYYGFRYVGLNGAVPAGFPNPENEPVVDNILFHHIRNSAPSAGHFQCSNVLFNRIYNLIDWAIRSNLTSVITDCPHREKLGWLEVPHLMGTSLQFTYDIRNLYEKIVDDMMDSQLENGLVPDIAPEYVQFLDGFRDSPEWGSSAVIIPWYLYEWYGDKQTMNKAWNMMTRYVKYLQTKSESGILAYGLGDWCDLGPKYIGFSQLTPVSLTATSIYFYDLSILSRMASILDKPDESKYYRKSAEDVKMAFLNEFYNPETHVIATGSQTSYSMPLVVGLIDPDKKQDVYNNLIKSIKQNEYALTAGDIGFHYLVRALQDAGADDIIWKMNDRDNVPGYGYQLRKGATSLTESWQALQSVSNNHMMLGHLMEWFFSGIGGLRQVDGSVGYQRIIIDPQPVGDLTWAEVSHTCIRGEIYIKWEKHNQKVKMTLNIPPDVEAEVRFSGKFIGKYTSGKYKINI
ncbi:MAG: family 78 glycoside hydrolase catalytic domain [Bacteroidales bacterium]|jgi:hypothetical protein